MHLLCEEFISGHVCSSLEGRAHLHMQQFYFENYHALSYLEVPEGHLDQSVLLILRRKENSILINEQPLTKCTKRIPYMDHTVHVGG